LVGGLAITTAGFAVGTAATILRSNR